MIKVGIIGCGFVGTALGRLLAPLHELNVHFRGAEERI